MVLVIWVYIVYDIWTKNKQIPWKNLIVNMAPSGFLISITINVFVYFVVYLAYLENYNQSNKPITIKEAIKYQLPYAAVTCVVYLLFIIIWYLVKFPIGVGAGVGLGV